MGGRQQRGDQGAGGGFAVAAGDGDRGLAVDQGGQHIGAMADRQPRPPRCLQFWVALGDRRADHDQRADRGAAADRVDRAGALLAEHPHPGAPQLLQHSLIAWIGAADAEAPLGQDPGDGRHADAADSNEMERLAAIKRWGQGHLRFGGADRA